MLRLSILDLATVCEGDSVGVALDKSRRLALRAEALGFHRFWLAEHHSMPGVASSATAVVISHVAGATQRIRVGAGGIMLPNHAPLIIAEQFGTLESLFPGRIDLGLGRAPGSGVMTQRALRRTDRAADSFVTDVRELQQWFAEPTPGQRVFAMPGAGLEVPLWILGSSTFGATVAADLGLPYAFASHFAPAQLDLAVERYRTRFAATTDREQPELMLTINVIAADSDEEAGFQYTSLQRAFAALSAGSPGAFPAPGPFHPDPTQRVFLDQALCLSVVGGPAAVERGLRSIVQRYRPQELMVTAPIFEMGARLRSLEITAMAAARLGVSLDVE